MSRVSDSRAERLKIIQQLAAHRKAKAEGSRATQHIPGQRIPGLEYSSEDDDDENEVEEVGDSPGGDYAGAGSSGARPLSRLRKVGDTGQRQSSISTTAAGSGGQPRGSADDLADQLGGLAVGPPAAAAAAARPPRSLLPTTGASAPRNPSSRPEQSRIVRLSDSDDGDDDDAFGGGSSDAGCLVLGDNGEFRLSASISQKLYPHQVIGVTWLHGIYKIGSGGAMLLEKFPPTFPVAAPSCKC